MHEIVPSTGSKDIRSHVKITHQQKGQSIQIDKRRYFLHDVVISGTPGLATPQVDCDEED